MSAKVEQRSIPVEQHSIKSGITNFAKDVKGSVTGKNLDIGRAFDITKEVNAYPIFWFFIWLLSIGILTLAILILQQSGLSNVSSNYTIIIATMASAVLVLTTIGGIARFVYGSRWCFCETPKPTAALAKPTQPAKVQKAPEKQPAANATAKEISGPLKNPNVTGQVNLTTIPMPPKETLLPQKPPPFTNPPVTRSLAELRALPPNPIENK